MRIPSQTRRGERGVTMLLVAASLVVLLGMAALAIDIVTLYVARTEAQRAADAAALAGARAFVATGFTSGQLGLPNSGTVQNLVCANSGSGGPVANLQATAAAAQNLVSGEPAQVIAIACNFAQPENPQITVTVQRTGLPTFFARIWGRRDSTVTATATGEAVNTSGTSMPVHLSSVKPWLIPNCDPLTGYPGGACATSNYFIDSTFALNNPTAYVGQSFVFHQFDFPSNPQQAGVFIPLDMSAIQAGVCPATSALPSGSCSEVGQGSSFHHGYYDNISCTNTNPVSCGDKLLVDNLNANSAGHDLLKADGIGATGCLTHSVNQTTLPGAVCADPDADCFEPPLSGQPVIIKGGAFNPNTALQGVENISRSDSVVTVPIYDGHDPCQTNCVGTPAEAVVIGFLQLGVQYVSPTGDIQATILNAVGCDPSSTGTAVTGGGISPIPVRLIHP